MRQFLTQGANMEGEGEIKATQVSDCGKPRADYSEPRIRL